MTAVLYSDDRPARRVPSSAGTAPVNGLPPRTVGALVAAAVIAALCLVGVVLSAGHAGAASVSATLQNYAFNPATLTVNVGDTVTWTNLDTAPHTVTSMSGPAQVSSPTLNQGDKFSYKFTVPGTYKLYCAIHPNMTETVVVGGVAPAATTPTTTASVPSSGAGSGGMAGMGGMPGMGGSSSGGSSGGTSSGGGASTPAAPKPTGPSAPAVTPVVHTTAASPACSNTMLVNAMLDPFVVHLDKAHLEESPGQQVTSLLNADQYAQLHLVLVEDMVMPLITAVQNALNGIDPLIVHIDKAHLEESPGQQVESLLNVDQYAQLHTVMVEDMLNPLTESVTGTYGC